MYVRMYLGTHVYIRNCIFCFMYSHTNGCMSSHDHIHINDGLLERFTYIFKITMIDWIYSIRISFLFRVFEMHNFSRLTFRKCVTYPRAPMYVCYYVCRYLCIYALYIHEWLHICIHVSEYECVWICICTCTISFALYSLLIIWQRHFHDVKQFSHHE